MFIYCTRVLHLSEGAAYNRIEAVRTAARCSPVLNALISGELNLTTVRLLSAHLTVDNAEGLIAAARHKTKREVELVIASLHPRPAMPAVIRKLPARREPSLDTPPSAPSVSETATFLESDTRPPTPAAPLPQASAVSRPVVQALAPERYEIQFTVDRDTHDKLRHAQGLLRHAIPNGDPAIIFDRALTLLIADVERRRFAAVEKPRAGSSTSSATSRHIPAAVRREVWKRDDGRVCRPRRALRRDGLSRAPPRRTVCRRRRRRLRTSSCAAARTTRTKRDCSSDPIWFVSGRTRSGTSWPLQW